MKKLETKFTRSGFEHEQIKRVGNIAMYRRTKLNRDSEITKKEERMREMESVISIRKGLILAQCRRGYFGMVTRKELRREGAQYFGYRLEGEIDCEFRISNLNNVRITGKWQSAEPDPIGYVTHVEAICLMSGATVSTGQFAGESTSRTWMTAEAESNTKPVLLPWPCMGSNCNAAGESRRTNPQPKEK